MHHKKEHDQNLRRDLGEDSGGFAADGGGRVLRNHRSRCGGLHHDPDYPSKLYEPRVGQAPISSDDISQLQRGTRSETRIILENTRRPRIPRHLKHAVPSGFSLRIELALPKVIRKACCQIVEVIVASFQSACPDPSSPRQRRAPQWPSWKRQHPPMLSLWTRSSTVNWRRPSWP